MMSSPSADSSPTAPISLQRGLLITFEGPDGSGKSSLARGVKAHLEARGIEPLGLFREPGDTEPGRRIRSLSRAGRFSISLEEEIDLFIQDRRLDIAQNINPIVERGGVVLLDRYYHSSIAYQSARGADPAEVRRRNEAFAPKPDMIILVKVPVEICLERIQSSRGSTPDLFEQRESLEKVCDEFDAMTDPQIRRVDGSGILEVVQSEVNAMVDALLAEQGV